MGEFTRVGDGRYRAQRRQLDFIGLGVGSSKPTTVVEMAVGDELYAHWALPNDIGRAGNTYLEVEYYLATSESGKLVSFDIAAHADEGAGSTINAEDATMSIVDSAMPEVAQRAGIASVAIPASLLGASVNDLQLRLRRVASSNDATADVRVVHLTVVYDQRRS